MLVMAVVLVYVFADPLHARWIIAGGAVLWALTLVSIALIRRHNERWKARQR